MIYKVTGIIETDQDITNKDIMSIVTSTKIIKRAKLIIEADEERSDDHGVQPNVKRF